jgi:hypothetical protein
MSRLDPPARFAGLTSWDVVPSVTGKGIHPGCDISTVALPQVYSRLRPRKCR